MAVVLVVIFIGTEYIYIIIELCDVIFDISPKDMLELIGIPYLKVTLVSVTFRNVKEITLENITFLQLDRFPHYCW